MTLRAHVSTGCLLLASIAAVVACSDDDGGPTPIGAAGQDPGAAGQGGSTPVGGGGSGGGGDAAAGAGAGGTAECENGLSLVERVDVRPSALVSWPEQRRFGVLGEQAVTIYEVEASGDVALVETVEASALGAGPDAAIASIAAYGTGFVALVQPNAAVLEPQLVRWTADGEVEALIAAPLGTNAIGAAAEGIGIAVASYAATVPALFVATVEDDVWSWSAAMEDEQGRRLKPLGFGDGVMVVGVMERWQEPFGEPGAGGAGGAGGADGGGAGGAGEPDDVPASSQPARIELWSLVTNTRVEAHETVGNPTTAVLTTDGWLIGETNSFWGSYQAAIELLGEAGDLRTLTRVPVISSIDNNDGAYDLAQLGDRVLVAGCESGLMAGDWSTSSVNLAEVTGPWHGPQAFCSPTAIEVVADVAALMARDSVFFVRACE
jgi:hypothetical protein